MLGMTQNAVEAIRDLMVGESLSKWAGLRIAAKPGEAHALEFSLVNTVSVGDEVVEKADVRVFVEPEAVAFVTDKVLDVQPDEQGRRNFRLVERRTAPE